VTCLVVSVTDARCGPADSSFRARSCAATEGSSKPQNRQHRYEGNKQGSGLVLWCSTKLSSRVICLLGPAKVLLQGTHIDCAQAVGSLFRSSAVRKADSASARLSEAFSRPFPISR
jgi:hypothetical protein